MKRASFLAVAFTLTAALSGCVIHHGGFDPVTGCRSGCSIEAIPGGPLDPCFYYCILKCPALPWNWGQFLCCDCCEPCGGCGWGCGGGCGFGPGCGPGCAPGLGPAYPPLLSTGCCDTGCCGGGFAGGGFDGGTCGCSGGTCGGGGCCGGGFGGAPFDGGMASPYQSAPVGDGFAPAIQGGPGDPMGPMVQPGLAPMTPPMNVPMRQQAPPPMPQTDAAPATLMSPTSFISPTSYTMPAFNATGRVMSQPMTAPQMMPQNVYARPIR